MGLVALLIVLAVAAWSWTAGRMTGMDSGPWTPLGQLGWFVSIWVVMMAAMMLPSVAPTVALYSRMTRSRSAAAPLLFTGGYLLTWAAAGLAAFAIAEGSGRVAGGALAWDRAGRWTAGATLIAAAAYELTPLKDVCLGKCRSPLGALLGSWRGGAAGAVSMGIRNGAWCVGCCWALMAALFALGVMSITWMIVIAALIVLEKLLPWRETAEAITVVVLLALAIGVAFFPGELPGLTTPDSPAAMRAMDSIGMQEAPMHDSQMDEPPMQNMNP